MCKLQIFAITNICKPTFVTFGRIGTGRQLGTLISCLKSFSAPGGHKNLRQRFQNQTTVVRRPRSGNATLRKVPNETNCVLDMNLSSYSGWSTFALVLQNFFLVKKTPCKKLAHLHPNQGNLLRRNNFIGILKTTLHWTK
jgi:hypothetical protein